jgi:Domain of unknown function (DUF397)
MKSFDVQPKRAAWRRSSFCAATECAEITRQDNMIVLRSSLAPRRVVKYTPEEFRALRLGMQAGEFDDLA